MIFSPGIGTAEIRRALLGLGLGQKYAAAALEVSLARSQRASTVLESTIALIDDLRDPSCSRLAQLLSGD